jgi:N-acetylglucosamine malate deacetylase 1
MKNKFNPTVLAIHAHPDDMEAFAAGTLKLLKNQGFDIVVATMTAGGMGGMDAKEEETIRIRKEEAKQAAAILNAPYYCLDGRDGYLFDTTELRVATTALIRKVHAGIVITHLPMDYHSDHRTTCNIVESAAIIASLPNVPTPEKPVEITPLLYHSAPLTLSDPIGTQITPPHFFVDITSVIDTKMKMLSFHQSQMKLMQHMHKMDDFFGQMKQNNVNYGKMIGVEYAEVFWQHLGGGFQRDTLFQDVLSPFIKYLH